MTTKRSAGLLAILIAALLTSWGFSEKKEERKPNDERKPNIVFILADDLGYGDFSSLNPDSKIITTHIDKLAYQGVMFTDAQTSSAVCSPTRYGILTGRYNWCSTLKKSVLNGYSKALISENTKTIAGFLKDNGYRTTDLFATVADALDLSSSIKDETAEDSYSFISALDIPSEAPVRSSIVHHSINGSFAYRTGDYKTIFCPGSGGWSHPRPGTPEVDGLPKIQLYDLSWDIGETENLFNFRPEIAEKQQRALTKIIEDGRSTAGTPQKNDGHGVWPQLW